MDSVHHARATLTTRDRPRGRDGGGLLAGIETSSTRQHTQDLDEEMDGWMDLFIMLVRR